MKTTQFRWLVTMLLLVTAMAMPKMAWAQVKYTVFDSSSGTLTFKYGEKPTGGGGITVYDIPDFSRSPEWNSQASSITTVVFDESFKDVRPKKCYCWFQSCSSLTTINGIENLNTEDVTDMDYMFYNCSSLTTLDLSGFNTAKVKYMYKMFFGCSELTTIYASSNFTTSAVTSSDDMFSGCTSLVGAKPFDSNTLDKTYANYQNGYFTYGIKTKDDLAMFANKVNGTYTPAEGETATAYTTICAELMADLTLTDTDVLPAIGSSGYSGTFDGCGHTISGLNFSSTSSALFAQNSGTIKNLGIVEATIAEGANGSFCQTNNGTIESCFFMGTTTGSSQSAGGICQTNNGTITNCYYLADSETDAIEGTTYKTTAQFKSGEVCYLLNGSTSDGAWGQTLSGTDKQDYPVLGGLPVYFRDEVYTNTYGILTIGTQTITASNEPLVWYEFTPSETASYQFSSTQLTASNLYVNTTKTESDYTDIATSPTYDLEAGTTYYVAVNYAPGTYALTIKKLDTTLEVGTNEFEVSVPRVWYEFTPSETASYQFSSTQLTEGNLYVNTTKSESDYTDIATSPTYDLEAATTYYVAVNYAPGSYDLTITRINNTPTAMEAVTAPQIYAVDGRIVCNGEFRIYDLLGRDVTCLNGSLCGVYIVKTADTAQKVVVK